MNKWILFCSVQQLFLSLLTAAPTYNENMSLEKDYAYDSCHKYGMNKYCLKKNSPTVKIRASSFFPSSKRFRDIYGSPLFTCQLECGAAITRCYQLWGNLDFLYKKGHSINLYDPATMQITTLGSGISLPYKFTNSFTAYIGLGAALGFIKVHNSNIPIQRNKNKTIGGAIFKSGLLYDINSCYFLDFFADYYYMQKTFKTHVSLGGFKVGSGIGLKF